MRTLLFVVIAGLSIWASVLIYGVMMAFARTIHFPQEDMRHLFFTLYAIVITKILFNLIDL